jgi:hypothetical protein
MKEGKTTMSFSLLDEMSHEQKISNDFELIDGEVGLAVNVREAMITTAKASLYLQKICKHFTHRVPAHWNTQQGKVFFDMGWCFMTAREHTLEIRCEANSESELEDILETIKRHFDRFAIKDQLILHWLK